MIYPIITKIVKCLSISILINSIVMTSGWTWLIFMAGDNNLEGAGKEDLDEMKKIGSNSHLNIIVQFDTEENKTTRYLVEKNELKILEEIPGINTGDPQVLTDFIKWGISKYPASHYLVDIWNHGGGWENLPPDYDYNQLRASNPLLSSKLKRFKRSLFRSTINKVHERPIEYRAIAIDTGSHDYLDNMELRNAIFNALPNNNKIDILGCDACLMNMIEICYENRDVANIVVGSEQTEPRSGWPYTTILEKLLANPEMLPKDLAKTITIDYGTYYQINGNPINDKSATQSALDLTVIQPIANLLNDLAKILIINIREIAGQIILAREKAQKFDQPEYIDLISFLTELIKYIPNNEDVVDLSNKTIALLIKEHNAFIIANSTWGQDVTRASGVSIYFPSSEKYLIDYKDLAFSRQCSWRQFLETLFQI